MKSLSDNWITEKHIDFEYKRYILMAYLQYVESQFDATVLYPHLAELINHYRQVVSLKKSKEGLASSFGKRLSGIDLNEFKLLYDSINNDTDLLNELESILNYSIPQFEKYVKEGQRIYEFVEKHIVCQPVGIVPIRSEEGYIFLSVGKKKETDVYAYEIALMESPDDRYRAIHTSYLTTYEKSITTTYEKIKIELIRSNNLLPNPAAYSFDCELQVPVDATLLPIAKRMLMRMVAVKGIN